MMKKTLLISLVIIFVAFTVVSNAQAVDGGYIELSYDILNDQGEAKIELWKNLGLHRIGIKGKSDIHYTLKGGVVPAAAPLNQYYEGYITIALSENLKITGTSFCTHWFSQSGRDMSEDESGISIDVRYEF